MLGSSATGYDAGSVAGANSAAPLVVMGRSEVADTEQPKNPERRGCVGIALGAGMVLIGIPMLVCPGPGLAMIAGGLAMIAGTLGLKPNRRV